MKIAIYSRKSLATEKGESVENQIEMCKEYIKTRLLEQPSEILVYEDEGFSGKNLDRPQFQKMIRDAKNKLFDCIICYRLDRISRNVSDFSNLIEDLNKKQISFICIKEQFDTTTPMGRAMMYIASVFAQLERETIAERVRDNMLMLARTGRWLGGTSPLGYVSEKNQEIIIDGRVKTSFKLKFNPDEIEIARTIFNKFLELYSVSGVSKYLIANNIKSRTGKYFSLLGIKEILENPIYCQADTDAYDYFVSQGSDVCFEAKDCTSNHGLMSYNKRNYNTPTSPRQEKSEWIISIGKHKGIVTGSNWVRIQQRLSENSPKYKDGVKPHNIYSLLSGMITCKKCNSKMFAKRRYDSANKCFLEVYDYICNNKLRGGSKLCDCKNLNGKEVDERVVTFLLKEAEMNVGIPNEVRKINLIQKTIVDANDAITGIDKKITQCKQEITNLISMLTKSDVSDSLLKHINSKVLELDEQCGVLDIEKKQWEDRKNYSESLEKEHDIYLNILTSIKDNFNTISLAEQREMIKVIVREIKWDGEALDIFTKDEGLQELRSFLI